MGEVYRATDTKLGRDVAIKVLPAELASDAERLARFEREAKLLASLNHSQIAHVYGFENTKVENGTTVHFLAMELVEGEDLPERLKRVHGRPDGILVTGGHAFADAVCSRDARRSDPGDRRVRDPRNRLRDIGDARVELIRAPAESVVAPAPGVRTSLARRLAMGARLLVAGVLLGRTVMGPGTPRPAGPAVRFTVTPPAPGGAALESRPLAGTEDATSPILSPDGVWLGFKQAGKLRKVALAGGDPVCDLAETTPEAAWGPGNRILYSPTWTNAGLWSVSAEGGPPVELTKPDRTKGEVAHFGPDFLPDGRHVVFTIYGGKGLVDSKVGLLDLETRRHEVLFDGAMPQYLHSGHILYYKRGAFWAVPFDAARLRATGTETVVLPGVRRLDPLGTQENVVTFSVGGELADVEGSSPSSAPLSRLAWVSRDGRQQDLGFEGNHYEGLSVSPDAKRAAVARVEGGEIQV